MNSKIETICRIICDYKGREPDFIKHGQPAWRRYESLARMILNELEVKEEVK